MSKRIKPRKVIRKERLANMPNVLNDIRQQMGRPPLPEDSYTVEGLTFKQLANKS